MDGDQPARTVFDIEQYRRLVQEGPCFVCAFLTGHPNYQHHLVYEDNDTVAFLARYPTLLGYTLVVPRTHIENWVEQMDEHAFLRYQSVVHRVARAIAATVPTERMYSMSLGSQQGNAHLHWHLALLPFGVPYDQQQFHAVMAEHGGLAVDDTAQAALAQRIKGQL